jgi:hypothetical protein
MVAAARGLLAGPSSRSQGGVFSLLDLFTPLLDLELGSLARWILWMGRRVGVGDMVSGRWKTETGGSLAAYDVVVFGVTCGSGDVVPGCTPVAPNQHPRRDTWK